MDLIEFYRAILTAAKLYVSEDGYVSSNLVGEKKPFLIHGKRLVIPTNEQLRNPDRESRIVFHLCRENAMQTGESEVLAAYRGAINTRINTAVALLVANLVNLASSEVQDKRLNPDQADVLRLMKNVDAKTFEALGKIIDAMPLGQTKKAFISIYIKKGGEIKAKKYKKAAIVSFPFYQELTEGKEDTVYGVKLRQKDKAALKALMEFLFPDIEVLNAYSAGSNSDVAPSLESLLFALRNVGIQINEKVDIYCNVIDDAEEITITSDWLETLEGISQLTTQILSIPTQLGNDGRIVAEPASVPDKKPTIQAAPEEVKTPLIPIKEKLTFVGLPNAKSPAHSVFNPSAPMNQPVARPNQGLSLSAAMRSVGGPSIGVAPFGQQTNTMFGQPIQQTSVFGQSQFPSGGSVFGGSRLFR